MPRSVNSVDHVTMNEKLTAVCRQYLWLIIYKCMFLNLFVYSEPNSIVQFLDSYFGAQYHILKKWQLKH